MLFIVLCTRLTAYYLTSVLFMCVIEGSCEASLWGISMGTEASFFCRQPSNFSRIVYDLTQGPLIRKGPFVMREKLFDCSNSHFDKLGSHNRSACHDELCVTLCLYQLVCRKNDNFAENGQGNGL